MDRSCYQSVIASLCENFPEAAKMQFRPESKLGELPDWDSMTAVNLQMHLQEQFEIELPLELLVEETTVQDIVACIEGRRYAF